jgi:hypothetical protein
MHFREKILFKSRKLLKKCVRVHHNLLWCSGVDFGEKNQRQRNCLRTGFSMGEEVPKVWSFSNALPLEGIGQCLETSLVVTLGRGDIKWVESRDATKYSIMHRTGPLAKFLQPSISNAKGKPCHGPCRTCWTSLVHFLVDK